MSEIIHHLFHSTLFWCAIAIVEFLVIVIIIGLYYDSKRRRSEFDEYKTAMVDMPNIFDSIYKAEALYKELAKITHPDKFVGDDRQAIAQELFKEVSENKRNYKALVAIKAKVESELLN